jgi:2',3'-cyclic-nucleotide 2'-phosphodiesterase (5'-nucleotidase family)
MQERRSLGPVLMVDGGDALFPLRGDRDPARAELILRAMAATGIDAAAVGELDLAMGGKWLLERSRATGVPYLAANLRDAEGASPFPPSKIVQIAGNRIGIFAVLEAHERTLPEGWSLEDPKEAAQREAEKLRAEGVDLLVALVHGPTALAHHVARTTAPDLMVPAHTGATTRPYRMGEAWVLHSGFEGRNILEVAIDLRGEGALVSRGHLRGIEEQLTDLQRRVKIADERIGASEPGLQRQELEELRSEFEGNMRRLRHEREAIGADEGRGFDARSISLDAGMAEDESFAQEVRKLGG